MRILNETGLLQGYVVTSREPPQAELSVLIRGTYHLDEEGRLVEPEGIEVLCQGKLDADVYGDDDEERSGVLLRPTDFAEYKPRAEVYVCGSCHLPSRVEQTIVTLAVGNWTKSVRVSGDRRWLPEGKPSRPALFDEMPIDYRRGFGGPESLTNPVGIGLEDGRLPNLELEGDYATSREARPVATTLGVVNPSWPTRNSKRGEKYGGDYARKRAPFHPEDFDWTYFMAAPADQWIPGGYLKGDERVVAKNLFATHPELDTRLPGVRPRVFLQDDEGARREVKVNLDTVMFDGDEETITLTWRGLTPVREIDLEDVAFLMVVTESMDEAPGATERYEAQLAAYAADPSGVLRMKEEIDNPERRDDVDPLTAKLMDQGLPVPPELQEKLKQNWAAIEQRGEEAQELLAKVDEAAAAREKGIPDEPPPAIPAYPSIKPRVFLRPQFELVRQQVAEMKQRLRPGLEPPEGLAIMEERLSDPRLVEMDPTMRDISAGAPGPDADLSGQDLTDKDLSGANLRGAKLEGCVCIRTKFVGADLTGASLDGAMLFKADFSRAFMTGANLARVNAAYATFDGASMDETVLDGAYFEGARFAGTKLDGARGEVVNFTEAHLEGMEARGLKLQHSQFEKALLEGARFIGAEFAACRFREAKLARSRFDEAQLSQAVFSESDLRGASFFAAKLTESVWLGAELEDADLAGADIQKAHFTKSNLDGARFEGANLRESRFYRCKLRRTDFTRSNLHAADLSRAKLGKTLFVKANLYDAKLIDARGPDCDFSGANLERAVYEEEKR